MTLWRSPSILVLVYDRICLAFRFHFYSNEAGSEQNLTHLQWCQLFPGWICPTSLGFMDAELTLLFDNKFGYLHCCYQFHQAFPREPFRLPLAVLDWCKTCNGRRRGAIEWCGGRHLRVKVTWNPYKSPQSRWLVWISLVDVLFLFKQLCNL